MVIYRTWGSSLSLKHKKEHAVARTLFFIFAGLAVLATTISVFMKGRNVALLNPKGTIANQERGIMIFAIIVVLAIAVPTVFILYLTAWKYRESNKNKAYHPAPEQKGKLFIITAWVLPTFFMLILAIVLVPATHKLAPQKAVADGVQPVTIQVVAMRWKWLFIYPDQKVASVNFVQIPKNTPIFFQLTADEAPMSSFWVPNISGQLYAMTGHVNGLNLMASKEGDYPGRSAEINGAGFEGMKFVARVRSEDDFNSWVKNVRSFSTPLDKSSYANLLKPSENNQITSYILSDNSLYTQAVMKYAGSMHMNSKMQMNDSTSMDMGSN